MVSTLDQYMEQVVRVVKDVGMWEDALVFFHSDNGGEIMTEFCGGNNYPVIKLPIYSVSLSALFLYFFYTFACMYMCA